MEVTLLKPEGYCAGVTNAIKIAYKAKEEHPHEDVYVLGMLVHNQKVIDELSSHGITTLYRDNRSDEEILYSLPDKSVVVFSAHGHIKKLDEIASRKCFTVYDATCPKVLKNLEIIDEAVQDKRQVIYVGHKDHPEALAALSHSDQVFFYDIKSEFNFSKVKDKRPIVINQTTLNTIDLKSIFIDIIVHKPKAIIMDEICAATRLRQESLKNLSSDIDLILIIGDKKSSNTNRLLEIARTTHPNIKSLLISDVEEIKNLNINAKHVAIASGASTPKYEIDKIVDFLKDK